MRNPRWIRPATLSCSLLFVSGAAVSACGPETAERADDASARATDQSPRSGGAAVIGTVTATVDGQARTWYVVEGQARNGPYASALWFAPEEGERMVTVGGFDTRRPPIGTFESSADGGSVSVSFGNYAGSAIVLAFTAPDGTASLTIDLEDPESDGTVGYMPVATTDPSGMYMFGPGSIQVTGMSFQGGKARVQGRFEGTLATMQGGGPVRIEDGRFEVSDIRALEEVER